MRAIEVPRAVVLLNALRLEGELVLETSCEDYDTFRALPASVTYQVVVCGKTGWSSDTGRACYKEHARVAHAV